MGSIDTVVFQALTVVLTLLGLVATGALWRLRGPASGLRMLGVALLPAAAYLTGTLRLLWEIGDAMVSWAVRFAFSPFVWLGIVLAGVAAVLFGVGSAMRSRGVGTRTGRARGTVGDRGRGRAANQSARSLPDTPARPPAQPTGQPTRQPTAQSLEGDDLSDIEAILKKHGIS